MSHPVGVEFRFYAIVGEKNARDVPLRHFAPRPKELPGMECCVHNSEVNETAHRVCGLWELCAGSALDISVFRSALLKPALNYFPSRKGASQIKARTRAL